MCNPGPAGGSLTVVERAAALCRQAFAQGRDTLEEPELYGLMQAGGLAVPEFFTLDPARPLRPQLRLLPGTRAVVKVVSALVTHKTEVGGVAVVKNTPRDIAAAVTCCLQSVAERGGDALRASVKQVMVAEFVERDEGLGNELLVGMRYSRDMGHVLAVGFGGLDAEELAERFRRGQGMVLFSPELLDCQAALRKLAGSYLHRRLSGRTRACHKLLDDAELLRVLEFFRALATRFSNRPEHGFIVRDFEVNPFLVSRGRLVAVDAFLRFAPGHVAERTVDPAALARLLQPATVGIVGASARGTNVGRQILRNLLREEFPAQDIRVIRKDRETLDGVVCAPSISALPWCADLLVVAVGAPQVPAIVDECLVSGKAGSVLLIPGGMGETEEGRSADAATRDKVFSARARGLPTPVLVGPNCIGIRSRPGRYNTLFVPEAKMPLPEGTLSNLALVCQSGAVMITRMNVLDFLDPRYAISTGNQMDLTVTDFVEHVVKDDRVEVIAVYIEGFKELDGLRLARLVEGARDRGKDVIVYKAGRTAEGRTATSSHTASISGDWVSCVEVLKDAGALMTGSFDEFRTLMALAALLKRKRCGGYRLGLLSNAGFETVGMADNIDGAAGFRLAQFSAETCGRLRGALVDGGIASLINVRNPLDLTPMATDLVQARCLEAIAADPGVDGVLMGFVPMTPAMKTLPPGMDPGGQDSTEAPGALPALLQPIAEASDKPVVTVVDAGRLYDPLAHLLEMRGIPCLRRADFAMRMLQRYVKYRVGREVGPARQWDM